MSTHNKSVDSPMLHRELRKVNSESQSVQRAQEGLEGTFRVGEAAVHVEPEWSASQRYGCKRNDTADMLTCKAGSTDREPMKKKLYDTSENNDWTNSTGSSIQKVLGEKQHSQKINRGDGWAQSSCSKTIENTSARRNRVIEKEPVLIPNEKVAKDPHHFVPGWNTECMKTVPQVPKKELDLAKPLPQDPPRKPVVRPEDWDSNLKTLPNCAKGVERRPHVFEDIKDSVVPQPHGKHRSF
eukprot:TRINITY_DN6319_c0_g1_i1.p1 TRINITY_DN6319_c0_g1~~TRINITY_DN6319_c0_g1_i1.p1  ORF type:complete len:240 (+),score=74.92 TRINITY_DN6319_c0_g1_i1:49-768(+)